MNIGILGCGAFGLALAHILNRNGCSIDMWTHNDEERKELDKKRVSSKLKGYKIPKEIKFLIYVAHTLFSSATLLEISDSFVYPFATAEIIAL